MPNVNYEYLCARYRRNLVRLRGIPLRGSVLVVWFACADIYGIIKSVYIAWRAILTSYTPRAYVPGAQKVHVSSNWVLPARRRDYCSIEMTNEVLAAVRYPSIWCVLLIIIIPRPEYQEEATAYTSWVSNFTKRQTSHGWIRHHFIDDQITRTVERHAL